MSNPKKTTTATTKSTQATKPAQSVEPPTRTITPQPKFRHLGHVIKFEIIRNLKKPSFWLAAIALPVLLVGYMFIAGANGMNASQIAEGGSDVTGLKLGLLDEAKFTDGVTIPDVSFTSVSIKDQGIADVKSGALNVFYFVPSDFSTSANVEIYAHTDQTSLFTSYEQPIRTLLTTAATSHVVPEDILALTNTYSVQTTNFTASGEQDDILSRMVVPIIVLALFYILICMFGNRLMMATIEEKENRITEMILTSLSPTTLIVGKIISLIALGIIQLAVLVIPVVIFYFYASSQGIIPIELNINWDPWVITSSILLLILSYFLFAGMGVAIGALVPTAKELAPYASIFMILVILPILSVSSFMSSEPSTFTYVLSYFPLSAPVALMLRNAFGTLPPYELIIGLIDIAIFSAIAIRLAVFIFKRSAMDFTSKISFRSLIAKGPRAKWQKSRE